MSDTPLVDLCAPPRRRRETPWLFKHGRSVRGQVTREYRAWCNAKDRCFDPENAQYKDYGGRGITMAAVWAGSFAAFFQEMGPCPPGLTLDRRDNSKGYEPRNCRWATQTEQNRNKRDNRLITVDGRTACVEEWAEITGIPGATIKDRLRAGWSPEDVVSHNPTSNPGRGGEHNGNAKLTIEIVREIRLAYLNGALQKDLAALHNVHRDTISGVVRGKTWSEA